MTGEVIKFYIPVKHKPKAASPLAKRGGKVIEFSPVKRTA